MKKRLSYLTIILGICVSAAAQEQPRPRGPEPVALPAEVARELDRMYTRVNAGESMSRPEAVAVQALVVDNRRFMARFDDESKAAYLILSAWTSFYMGNDEESVRWAMMAKNTREDDPDVKATLTAIGILAGRPQLANVVQAQARAPRPRPRGEEAPVETTMAAPTGKLALDITRLNLMAMGRKATLAEGQSFACINGGRFVPARGASVFALIWKMSATGQPQPVSYYEEGSSDQEQDGQADFKSLFVKYFGSEKIQFIGVNIDPEPARFLVMESLAQKIRPWMQTMSEAGGNRRLADLVSIVNPGTEIALAVIAPDGTIQYAGPASGFLPKLLAAKATDNFEAPVYLPPSARPDRRADPNNPGGVDPNRPAPAGPNRSTSPSSQGTGDQQTDEFEAERIFNVARSYLRNPALPSASQGVNLCRQILREYPNSEHAEKARELLRDLPDHMKERHRITPEEQGL